MKKKLLFVIESLGGGGAEKSLVSLLSLLDYERYDVDLQLFAYGGLNQRYVPKPVNILPPLPFFEYCSRPIFKQLASPLKFISRLLYSLSIRKKSPTHPDKARLFWQHCAGQFSTSPKLYDVAIAYAQGTPTFYVVDKINAIKKFAWVNVALKLNTASVKYYDRYFKRVDAINAVSESAEIELKKLFNIPDGKIVVIRDIISQPFINRLAAVDEDRIVKTSGDYIITVARLTPLQKGMDILLDVCKILHARGLDFKWYIIGSGTYREEMLHFIKENGLSDCLHLLGTTHNPYPTMKHAMLYVQTSRHEGFGLTLAEARLLNVPVVTTAYEGWEMQMVPDKNGIVTQIDANAVADAVEFLLKNPEQRVAISSYQQSEKKGNHEEIAKFYNLIEISDINI